MIMAQKPPGPKGDFLLGSLRPFSQDPPGFLVQVAQEYGPIAHLRMGPFQAYLLSQPKYIREVLVAQAAKFYKDRLDKRILSKFLGNGLLISDGDFHRRQRALAQPAFHTGRIQAYGQVMVAYTEDMMAEWQPGQVRQIDQDMMHLTMFIVAKTLFDADVSERAEEAGRAIEIVQAAANLEYRRAFSTPMWVPTPNNRKMSRASKSLDRIIGTIVTERRATAQNGLVMDTGDLLSMLLLARYEDGSPMSDEQVRDEAVTLFAAGHETTANAMTWTWYFLAQNPEVEDKLGAELDQVLAGQAPTVDDLGRLPYSQMVIKESLRLRPPVWILNGRQAMADVTIGPYTIPEGSTIFIAPYVMHRQSEYFPDPEKFDPERFRPEKEKDLPRYAYMPFGGGPRVCIGNSFAMMEAQLILATVAQRYRLSLANDEAVELQPQITLSPKGGLEMQIAARPAA
jgi:cytochrome P450